MAAPPPPLPDVLVEEILVRLPADDPASLLRTALACKRWARLVSGPGFRRRFREFHRGPPMLGFLCDLRHDEGDGATCRFIPTSPFRPRIADRRGWRAADTRHGRVLLYPKRTRFATFPNVLSVWIPFTGEQWELPELPRRAESWNAAVLCGGDGTAADGACGHHPGCHSGPFRVVFVGTDKDCIFSCVYSSVDDAWSEPASAEHPGNDAPGCLDSVPGVLVGSALYFLFQVGAKTLRYDLDEREVSVIEAPPECIYFQGRALLMNMEDGRLGFASVHYYGVSLWRREVGADGEERWAQIRGINLARLLPADSLLAYPCLMSFADDVGVLFVWSALAGIFLVNLKSGQVRNMRIGSDFYGVIPFVSYYIPALRIAAEGVGDGSSTGAGEPQVLLQDLQLKC